MRILFSLLLLCCLASPLLAADTDFAQHAPLALRAAQPNAATVPRYGKFELTLDLAATYDNPFDPDQIDVGADFTSPKGVTTHVNGFLDQDFTRTLDPGEKLTPAGPPVWRIRFAPDTVGTWRYRVSARDSSGRVSLPDAAFQAVRSDSEGFARVSATNPHVFAYADNKPLFLIGEDMCWGGGKGTFSYDDWLPKLAAQGGNWIRLWSFPSYDGLEWTPGHPEDHGAQYHGLGAYSLDNAWKLDKILDTAKQNGVSVMLCLGYQGEFSQQDGFFKGNALWPDNPYNAANGGPCATPADFWTNATARAIYRNRLRYLAARYGWRDNLMGWELWNEVQAPAPWIAEMARCLKGTGEFAGHGADPYKHLVSTTYGDDAVWKTPEIDFTMTHDYGSDGDLADHAPIIAHDALHFRAYGKPHLMAEFGIAWQRPDTPYDPNKLAINFQHGLWSSLASGNAGTAMIWWWDSYIDPDNLYTFFRPVQEFTAGVPWTDGDWTSIAAETPRIDQASPTFGDLVIPTNSGFSKSAGTDFTVTPTGVAGDNLVTQFLFGPGKAEMRTVPAFHVDYERPGQFIIHVGDISQFGDIQMLLDGAVARDIKLSASPAGSADVKAGYATDYKSTEFNKEYKIYQATYDKDYSIDVPAGKHVISLQNIAGDWTALLDIRLTGYRSSEYPNVAVYGQTNGKMAVLWLENADYNWKTSLAGADIPTYSGVHTTLHGLRDGSYRAEWWDIHTGQIVRTDPVVSRDNSLELHAPDLATSFGIKIVPAATEASR